MTGLRDALRSCPTRRYDRRRATPWRMGMFCVGSIIAMMGFYAFSDRETLFTQALARMGIEGAWGITMMVAGVLHFLGGVSRSAILTWAANAVAMLVCGWTFILVAMYLGTVTPTIGACGLIAFWALMTMVRDAYQNLKTRARLHGRSH